MYERNNYNSIPEQMSDMKEGIDVEEVFRVNSIFFTKPYHKQRKVLRVLIWWSIKKYVKTLFKTK